MESLGEILREKGSTVYTSPPTATVLEAVETMGAKHVGAVLVCDEGGLIGILSERDILTRVILAHRDPGKTTVSDVMTREIVCADPETSGEEAMAIMTDRRVRHLPVVSGEGLEGIISIGDLVRVAARDQEFEVRMLIDYVSTGAIPPSLR
jgi:CBS domain-containing protein